MKVLIDEVCKEVECIFEVYYHKNALDSALDASTGHSCIPNVSLWPLVIPISAGNAFLYQTACRLKLEDFKKLDADFIDKIGHNEVGRLRWKKLLQDEKYEAVYSSVIDDSNYKKSLEATQFDKFLKIMCCGGAEPQQKKIQSQVHIALKNHIFWEHSMANNHLHINKSCMVIGMPANIL